MRHLSVLTCCFTVLAVGPVAAQAHQPIRATFRTADGVEIVGDYWTPIKGEPAAVVVLLHMYRSQRSAYQPLVPALEQAGLAILAIDLRGHGESVEPARLGLAKKVEDRDAATFQAMYQDVAGAYQWLSQRPEVDLGRLAIVGASVGCSVALDYAARDRSVDALVLLTPGASYLHLDSIAHVAGYGQRPIMMLTSEEERARGTAALAAKVPQATVHVYPQSDIHGTKMFGKVPAVEPAIAQFIQQAVGAPTDAAARVIGRLGDSVYYRADSPQALALPPAQRRVFSTAAEAQARGLTLAGD